MSFPGFKSKQRRAMARLDRVANARYKRQLIGIGMSLAALAASTAMADQAWWTGLAGSNWTAGLTNWNTSATSGIAVSALPGASTEVYFSTTSPRATTSNSLSANLTINSF